MPTTPGLCTVRACSPQMGNLYASAIGTTVLQLKELPPRPPEYDGKLCLFGLAPGVDEAAVQAALALYGDIASYTYTLGRKPSAIVCFTTHAAAQAAKRAAAQLTCIADGVDMLFNERSYDGRHGEAGLDDDEGRGWCVFESAVSGELILRLSAVPRMKKELDKLPPKLLVLRSGYPLEAVDLSAGRLETRVAEVEASIDRAIFTGKGDKRTVLGLYKKYVGRIADALQRVLPRMLAPESARNAPAELLPLVDAPAAAALRLAEGQPLLLLSQQDSGVGGRPRFGVVDGTGARVAAAVTGGDDVELAYDRCSQAVLPWRPPAAGWDAALVGDARALRDLAEPARCLAEDALQIGSESALCAVGERACEIIDGAARCQTMAHAAREAGDDVRSCVDAAAELYKHQKRSDIEKVQVMEKDNLKLQLALDKVRKAIDRLQPVALEAVLTAALRSSGAIGARRFAASQLLTVRTAGGWRDADVAIACADGLCHHLAFESIGCSVSVSVDGGSKDGFRVRVGVRVGLRLEPPATLTLHPWNHAPRELPHAAFEAMRAWWARSLGAHHANISDVLSGKRLDTVQQCVAITVDAGGVAGVTTQINVPQHQHILKLHRRDRGYRCDVCRSSFSGGEQSYYCSNCDFDACLACSSKIFRRSEAGGASETAAKMYPSPLLWKLKSSIPYNIRSGPSFDASVVTTVTDGAVLKMKGEVDGWLILEECSGYTIKEGKDGMNSWQCVEANPISQLVDTSATAISDAHSLASWLCALHRAQLEGGPTEGPLAVLLTAGPASGKTTLLSQLVILALKDKHTELVPILVKVQVLQRRLLEAPDAFAGAWNYIDAFLRLELEASHLALYRMLRQAMMARRALILLDGLDEAGAKRAEIECHVVEVLAPQGHVLLCTSRAAGIDEARFAAFRRLALAPLSDAQQERGLEQRLGAERKAALLPYVRDIMQRDDTGRKVTSNPLMLSMMASLYELRQGVGMPTTKAGLYATASDAMLARGGVTSPELTRLLQRIFFEAHVVQRRLIEDRQLNDAALGLEAPEALAKIRAEAAAIWEPFGGRAEVGHYVEVTKDGEHKGKRGVITTDDKALSNPGYPYIVTFADGTVTPFLRPNELRSSGLDKTAFLQRATAASTAAVRVACEARLSEAMRRALRTVRERVLVDALPLLSLWQSEPLQLQSSHLSFQEYFAARALCEEGTELSGTPPWQWPAWWANAVELGAEMGNGFGRGLLRAAGVTGETLDLSQKLGGDRPTVRRVLAVVVASARELRTFNLSQNKLDAEDARALAPALMKTALARVDVRGNDFAGDVAAQLSAAVLGNPKIEMFNEIPIKEMRGDSIAELDLKQKKIGVEGGMVVAALLPALTLLARVDVRGNDFAGDVAAQLSAAVLGNPKIEMFNEIPIKEMRGDSITELGLRGGEDIGVEGGMVVSGLMPATTRLVECNVRGHKLDNKLAKMLAKIGIEKGIMLFGIKRDQKEANLSDQNLGPVDAILFASDLRVNALLTSVNLSRNQLGEEGTKLICDALKGNTTLKHLDLSGYLDSNIDGPAGAKHVADLLTSSTVLIECNVLRNKLNHESAKILANIGTEKGIMLSGIKRDQKEAEFYSRRDNTFLGPVNAILIASDLRVNTLLTSVNLSNNKWGVDGTKFICDALKGNTTLKHLDLSGGYYNPNIGGAAGAKLVADLLGASSLASITLMANDIGPTGAKALAPAFCSNTLLTSVNLSDNNLGEEGTKIICDALKGNTALKHLDLSGGWRGALVCNIGGAAGAKHLADLLRASALLAYVDVRHNDIKGDAAAQLSAAVLSNFNTEMFNKIPIKEMRSDSITHIDLMDEGIGVVGGLVLAGLIPAMTRLTSIDLSCNDLGPEGVKALAPAIRASESLTSIDVGSNDIDQATSLELLAVMKSKNMVSIGMASCKLGVEGAKQVADLLGASELLARIDLSGNNLGPEGAKTLAPAISASTVLARVDLRYNNIGPEGADALASIISASTLDLSWNDLGLL